MRSSGQPLVLKLLYHSMTSSVMLIEAQCDRRRRLPISRLSKSILPGGYIEVLGRLHQKYGQYQSRCGVHPINVPVHILLDGGGNYFCSRPYFQGEVVRDILCLTVLRKVLMREMH